MQSSLEKNEYGPVSLSQVAVKYIEDKILYGELKSGDKVNEYGIAEELRISRAPVREAVRELQMAGLLDFEPRKGSRVAVVNKNDIDEIFDIRISLEKDIIEILIKNNIIDAEIISILEEKANYMFNMANQHGDEKRKIYTLNQLDIDFHSYLWNLAESPRRARMLQQLFIQLVAAMNKNTDTLGKIEEKAKEHYEIVQIFKSRDLAFAYKKMAEHINHYRTELYEIL